MSRAGESLTCGSSPQVWAFCTWYDPHMMNCHAACRGTKASNSWEGLLLLASFSFAMFIVPWNQGAVALEATLRRTLHTIRVDTGFSPAQFVRLVASNSIFSYSVSKSTGNVVISEPYTLVSVKSYTTHYQANSSLRYRFLFYTGGQKSTSRAHKIVEVQLCSIYSRPQVAEGGTASNMEGSCEYKE